MHRYETLEVSPTYDEVRITFSHGPGGSSKAAKDGSQGVVRPRHTVTLTKDATIALAAVAATGSKVAIGGVPFELSNGDDFAAAVAVTVAPSAAPSA